MAINPFDDGIANKVRTPGSEPPHGLPSRQVEEQSLDDGKAEVRKDLKLEAFKCTLKNSDKLNYRIILNKGNLQLGSVLVQKQYIPFWIAAAKNLFLKHASAQMLEELKLVWLLTHSKT